MGVEELEENLNAEMSCQELSTTFDCVKATFNAALSRARYVILPTRTSAAKDFYRATQSARYLL